MGDITIKGIANKKVIADKMCINITIRAKEKTTNRALSTVREQSESLLEMLESVGVDISKIKIKKDLVEENDSYHTDNIFMVGKKELEIQMAADVKVANMLMGVIQNSTFDIEANVKYFVEDTTEIYKMLFSEAVLDSKEKATAIAEVLGEEIVGAKEIKNVDFYNRDKHVTLDHTLDVPCFLMNDKSETPLLDDLGLPEEEFEKELVVEWITEEV